MASAASTQVTAFENLEMTGSTFIRIGDSDVEPAILSVFGPTEITWFNESSNRLFLSSKPSTRDTSLFMPLVQGAVLTKTGAAQHTLDNHTRDVLELKSSALALLGNHLTASSLSFSVLLDPGQAYTLSIQEPGDYPFYVTRDGQVESQEPSGVIQLSGTVLLSTSPYQGESGVAPTRETVLEFSSPVDSTSILTSTFMASWAGTALDYRLHVSSDQRRVTLFYAEPLPGNARIQLEIDGSALRDSSGELVHVDLDATSSPQQTLIFDTLNLASVPGTQVCGSVYASELRTMTNGSGLNQPLSGVTITVDGREQTLRAKTDTSGNFCIEDAPAGRFFVHIDGRTAASTLSSNGYYPTVGKSWTSEAGTTVNVGDIYLPWIPEGTLTTTSADANTSIDFADSVLENDPRLAGTTLLVPADALFADNGTRGGQVGIAPVAPERLPGVLPDGLDFPLVITVQTNGATNFDTPAPICFPNLPLPQTGELLDAGESSALWSFNHDKGTWEIAGSMTVTDDGKLVCSDPGSGIRAPGWHGAGGGNSGSGGGGVPPSYSPDPDTDDCLAECNERHKENQAALKASLDQLASILSNIPRPPRVGQAEKQFNCLNKIAKQRLNLEAGLNPTEDYMEAQFTCLLPYASKALAFPGISGGLLQNINRLRQNFLSFTACNLACLADAGGQNSFRLFPTEEDPYDRIYAQQDRLQDAGASLYAYWMGDTKWVESDASEITVHLDIINSLHQAMLDASENGFIIGPAEAQSILQLPRPTQISLQDVEKLIVRLNLLSDPEQPLPGGFDVDEFNALANQLETVADELDSQSWETTLDGLELAVVELSAMIDEADLPGGVLRQPLFYRISGEDPSVVFRGTLNDQGRFANLILPADTLLFVELADPLTNQVGISALRTQENGATIELPRTLLTPANPQDTDNDGLPDEIESIIGTSTSAADTDGDGATDGVEIAQGSDPLDNLPVRIGLLATVDTIGEALDICLINDLAIIADGSGGVAIFNSFNSSAPAQVGQLQTEGSVQSVTCGAAVATSTASTITPTTTPTVDTTPTAFALDDEEGVLFLSLERPDEPMVEAKIRLESAPVTAVSNDRYVYVGLASGKLAVVSIAERALLGTVPAPGLIQDLAIAPTSLAGLLHDRVVLYALEGPYPRLTGTVKHKRILSDSSGSRLYHAGNLLYMTHVNGYDTIDIADMANPQLLGRTSTSFGTFHGITALSQERIVASLSRSYAEWPIAYFDGSDPSITDNFQFEYETPGQPIEVVSHQGLIYAADGDGGMAVLNYASEEVNQNDDAFALELSLNNGPIAGIEGTHLSMTVDAADGRILRNATFLVDNEPFSTDSSFPFQARIDLPFLDAQNQIAIQATAESRLGQVSQSSLMTVSISPDALGPTILQPFPAPNAKLGPVSQLSLLWDEPLLTSTLSSNVLQIDGQALSVRAAGTEANDLGGTLVTSWGNRQLNLLFDEPLQPMTYTATLAGPISDRFSNTTNQVYTWTFTVVDGGLTIADAQFDDVAGVDGLFQPGAVVVSPDSNHVYVASKGDDTVSLFSRNALSNSLQFESIADTAEVPDLALANDIAMSPDGRHLYAIGGSPQAVSIFRRDGNNGRLQFLKSIRSDDEGMDILSKARTIALSPDGQILAVTAYVDDAIAIFERDSETGDLTLRQSLRKGEGGFEDIGLPTHIQFGGNSRFGYIASHEDNAITVLERDPNQSTFSQAQIMKEGGNQFSGLSSLHRLAVSPDGLHLYGVGRDNGAIYLFAIDEENGHLSDLGYISNPTDALGGIYLPQDLAFSPNGAQLYVVAWEGVAAKPSGSIAVFARDPESGRLALRQTLRDQDDNLFGIATPARVTITNDGLHLLVTGTGDNGLVLFSRASLR